MPVPHNALHITGYMMGLLWGVFHLTYSWQPAARHTLWSHCSPTASVVLYHVVTAQFPPAPLLPHPPSPTPSFDHSHYTRLNLSLEGLDTIMNPLFCSLFNVNPHLCHVLCELDFSHSWVMAAVASWLARRYANPKVRGQIPVWTDCVFSWSKNQTLNIRDWWCSSWFRLHVKQ